MIKIGTYEYDPVAKIATRVVKVVHQDILLDEYCRVVKTPQEESDWINWKTIDKMWEYKWL